MANKATITYNGKDVLTEEKEGNFDVLYKENVIATLGAGQSKTLFCKNKVMRSDVKIGSKTLFCKTKKMYSDIKIMVESLFPPKPSSYNLIETYTSSQTWRAPENGHYQIEVFGASGKGGASYCVDTSKLNRYFCMTGGGGGGGGYSASRVELNKGDTVVLTVGGVGATTSAVVNSSYNNSHDHTLQVTSGENGTDKSGEGLIGLPGEGGDGGVASGGNYSNANGLAGSNGKTVDNVTASDLKNGDGYVLGGTGANGAPNGGNCQRAVKGWEFDETGRAGSPGFIKIYRGNTN